MHRFYQSSELRPPVPTARALSFPPHDIIETDRLAAFLWAASGRPRRLDGAAMAAGWLAASSRPLGSPAPASKMGRLVWLSLVAS